MTVPAQRGHRVRGPVAAHLLAHHAISPRDAIAYTPAGRTLRWWFAHHQRTGAIRRLADGRVYFDLPHYYAHAEARSQRVVPMALIAAVAIVGIAVALYQG